MNLIELSSFAGVRGFVQFINSTPKRGDATNFFDAGARLDYNILNQLKATLIANLHITQSSNDALDKDLTYQLALGFSYRLF